jgi:protein-L-isoaspartate(D-aspartate) O-methyltransferase
MRPDAERAHHDLIDRLIAGGALWSAALIDAFRATPRLLFLDRVWLHSESTWLLVDPAHPTMEALRAVYSDRALTTHLAGEGGVAVSSSSQPSLMAQMLEDLRLQRDLRVLEIGAGTGYNAALLAHVVGSVVSLDVDAEVLADAQRHLEALPDRDVLLYHGDGREGYPAAAPFDRIQVTAATPDLEPAWLEQLAPDGLVMAPLDVAPGLSFLVCGTARRGVFDGRLTRAAYFLPLRDEAASGRAAGSSDMIPPPDRLQAVASPWARWPERRQAVRRDFLPALGFLGWLHGLTLAHGNLPEGGTGFGVADLVQGSACWMGWNEWRVTGTEGHALGQRLWRTFLDNGGPGPTEYRLRAARHGTGLRVSTEAQIGFRRDGVRCERVWELIEPRDRPEEW